MEEQTYSLESIMERMKNPAMMRPAEVTQSYMFLAQLYAHYSVELCDVDAAVAAEEGKMLQDDPELSSAKAKQIVRGSVDGLKEIKLRGRLKAIEELIKALKRAQRYQEFEITNQV